MAPLPGATGGVICDTERLVCAAKCTRLASEDGRVVVFKANSERDMKTTLCIDDKQPYNTAVSASDPQLNEKR